MRGPACRRDPDRSKAIRNLKSNHRGSRTPGSCKWDNCRQEQSSIRSLHSSMGNRDCAAAPETTAAASPIPNSPYLIISHLSCRGSYLSTSACQVSFRGGPLAHLEEQRPLIWGRSHNHKRAGEHTHTRTETHKDTGNRRSRDNCSREPWLSRPRVGQVRRRDQERVRRPNHHHDGANHRANLPHHANRHWQMTGRQRI